MILSAAGILYNSDERIQSFFYCDFEVHFKGLFFTSGKRAGKESIEFILSDFLSNGNIDFSSIYGNYFVYIIDKKNNKQYFFVDNSSIFKAYIYKNSISTSFIEIIDNFKDISVENLNHSGVVEFLHFGFTYFENTLINDIYKISGNDFYVFEDDKLIKKEKGLQPINSESQINFDQFFKDLIYAVNGLKVSLDLTGGFDSRLILSYFQKNGADFELAISGMKGNSDIEIASKLSKIVKKEFCPTFHSLDSLNEETLKSIFINSDSQIDILEYHRNSQLNYDRNSRGVELQISGVGGELYKDFWWLQDFPFYNSSKIKIEKLYNLRIESSTFPHSIFEDKLKEYSLTLKSNTVNHLEKFILGSNTETYDNIYYSYKMNTNAGVYLTIANNFFTAYAPLLENELVKVGFNLKRRQRFYNNFHRNKITQNSSRISRVRTTEGISASSFWLDKIIDIIYYVADKTKRLIKQILRKIYNITYLQETPTNPKIYSIIKSNSVFEDHLKILKENNILKSDLNENQIPDKLIGRILTLGCFVKRVKQNSGR